MMKKPMGLRRKLPQRLLVEGVKRYRLSIAAAAVVKIQLDL